MILYHGSKEIVRFPEVRKATFNKDFYFGFYCTVYKEQAKRWATRYGKKGYVNSYDYIPNPELKYLKFGKMTDEWLDFIAACRTGKSHTYEQAFVDGKISRAAFWELAKFNHPTHQISFHTISALDTLTFTGSEEVYGNKK